MPAIARNAALANQFKNESNFLKEQELARVSAAREEELQRWLARFDADNSGDFDREELASLLCAIAKIPYCPDEYLDTCYHQEWMHLRKQSKARPQSAPAGPRSRPQPLQQPDEGGGRDDRWKPPEPAVGAYPTTIPAKRVHIYVTRFTNYLHKKAELERMFEAANSSGSGELNVDELKTLLERGTPRGQRVTDADLERVMVAAGEQRDGTIPLEKLSSVISTWMALLKERKAIPPGSTPRSDTTSAPSTPRPGTPGGSKKSSACVLQ